MRFIYAIAISVLESIEDSAGTLALSAWISVTVSAVVFLKVFKTPYSPFWGFVAGLVCAAAAWGFCWACGKGVKALHRVHRPESQDLKKARESK